MTLRFAKAPRGLLALLFCALLALTACGSDETPPPIAPTDGDAETQADGDPSETDTDGPRLVKAPPSWNPNPARTPVGLHLTYQHDPATTITLQWATGEHDDTLYQPKVWLVPAGLLNGADPTKFEAEVALPYVKELVFTGAGERYCSKYMCTADKLDGLMWVVEATGLQPDTDYYYRVGSFERFDENTNEFVSPDLSPVYHFHSGPAKGAAKPFIVGFGSDSQNWFPTLGDDLKIIRNTYGNQARFWLFGGDLTETGTETDSDDWFQVMQPFLPYYPAMPVLGNHAIFLGVAIGRWALPQMGSPLDPKDLKHAWSFSYGNAHFIGLDSTSETVAARQAAWLEADLAAARADRDITWIVVTFHIPPYSSSDSHGSNLYIQTLWVPLFDRYKVDLCLSGHDHDYERTKPLKGGLVQSDGTGTVYIVSGGFYAQKSYGNGKSDFTAVSFDGPSKSHLMLIIGEKTLNGQAYKGNHEPLDSFSLSK